MKNENCFVLCLFGRQGEKKTFKIFAKMNLVLLDFEKNSAWQIQSKRKIKPCIKKYNV